MAANHWILTHSLVTQTYTQCANNGREVIAILYTFAATKDLNRTDK